MLAMTLLSLKCGALDSPSESPAMDENHGGARVGGPYGLGLGVAQITFH